MNVFPSVFRKPGTQAAYVLVVPVFFLLFAAGYKPFGMAEYLSMGRNLLFFNITIMMCIILGCLTITRTLLLLLKDQVCRTWLPYAAYCLAEMLFISFFLALFVHLMAHRVTPYFVVLSTCAKYSFLILPYPYIILSLIFEIMWLRGGTQEPETQLIRFSDARKQIKLVVDRNAVLYIGAEENYVRIHYLDGENVKDYQLRASMRSMEPVAEEFGLVRCQRSYYINPSHIKALRKEKNDQINAELDAGGIVIPVSRKVYPDLSELI